MQMTGSSYLSWMPRHGYAAMKKTGPIMRERSTLSHILDDKHIRRADSVSRIPPVILLALVLPSVMIATSSNQPPSVSIATDIVLFVLMALLCTLVAVSFAPTGFAQPLMRVELSSQPAAADVTPTGESFGPRSRVVQAPRTPCGREPCAGGWGQGSRDPHTDSANMDRRASDPAANGARA